MIEINKEDFNMAEIDNLGKISEIKTKKNFEVCGLRQEGNVPIGIYYNMDKISSNQFEDELTSFFKSNGLELGFDNREEEKILIGIRRDIRENIGLAANLIKTIALHIDGQLELESSFRIPGLSKFVSTEEQPA